MTPGLQLALRNTREALNALELALADSEPAPYSLVLTQDRSTGVIHRRGRIDGLPGLMGYEGDNTDASGAFDVIPDLSRVSDEALLCERCFGDVDDAVETT